MRVIRKSASGSGEEVIGLLGSLFALELVSPSRCLWLVSPWVTDIPLLDNRFGSFPMLDPFGRRVITLAEVLATLARHKTTIVVALRDDSINIPFRERLKQLEDIHAVQMSCIYVPREQRLHDKALAGDDFVIAGSMNFTYSGAILNEEQVQLHTDDAYVAKTQTDLFQRFGGVLA
jgi:hypothetical protein